MPLKTKPFDPADHLATPAIQQAYLDEALEGGDTREVLGALGDIARARNFSQLARNIGLSRQGLMKALGPDGNPSFDTVLKLATALKLRLALTATPPTTKPRGKSARKTAA
jgi:probable addiction module antidote protein